MILKRSAAIELLLILVVVKALLLLNSVADGSSNSSSYFGEEPVVGGLHRVKRRTQPQQGYFFPIAMYTVRHHKPGGERGRTTRPETWEYRGQYFYGYKPRAATGRRQAARLLAAGLPLLLAPLLSIIFSFPVLVPVSHTTTVTTSGAGPLGGPYRPPSPWVGRRKRRRRRQTVDPRMKQHNKEKANRMKELEIVSNYLHQVDYDESQQSRVMVNYLQCNGLLGTDDHCLERLSCEFADPANQNAPELERTVTSILLGHMLNNDFLPGPFKKRLKAAAIFGRNNSSKCSSKYFCQYVDNNWDYTSTYPQSPSQVTSHLPRPQRPTPPNTLPVSHHPGLRPG